jgi:hypothetical protein
MGRLALEFALVFLVFVVFVVEAIHGIILSPRPDQRVDGAYLDWAQLNEHLDERKLRYLPRRLRGDRTRHVGRRTFGRELSVPGMLNVRLAPRDDFIPAF